MQRLTYRFAIFGKKKIALFDRCLQNIVEGVESATIALDSQSALHLNVQKEENLLSLAKYEVVITGTPNLVKVMENIFDKL